MDEGIAKMNEAWAVAEGEPSVRRAATIGNFRPRPACPCGSAARVPPRAAGPLRWETAGLRFSLRRTTTGRRCRRCVRRPKQPGATPTPSKPAVVIFARVGPDDEAPARGAEWLSDMYGVPPKAFERHLVAGEPEACAASLGHYVEAGARHVIVMVAGTGAVGHFASLRVRFIARTHPVPAAVSA